MMKAIVTVSRKWHNPEITTTVWQHGEDTAEGVYVVIRMDMADFQKALSIELGVSQESVDKAVEAIRTGMKYEWLKHPL